MRRYLRPIWCSPFSSFCSLNLSSQYPIRPIIVDSDREEEKVTTRTSSQHECDGAIVLALTSPNRRLITGHRVSSPSRDPPQLRNLVCHIAWPEESARDAPKAPKTNSPQWPMRGAAPGPCKARPTPFSPPYLVSRQIDEADHSLGTISTTSNFPIRPW